MLISSMTMTSLSTEETFTPTLMSPIWMADGVLKPSGFPTNSLESRPPPENGEMSAEPRRTSTLVISGPRVSTPFLTMEFSEKKTTTRTNAMRTTPPRPMRRNNFFISSAPFRRYHRRSWLQASLKEQKSHMQRENQVHFPRSRLFRGGEKFLSQTRGSLKNFKIFLL